MTLEALIFDLDGTLVETAPDLHAATNHVLQLAGRRPISMAEVRSFVGHGARMLIRRGLEATGGGVDDATEKKLLHDFLDYYGANIAVHSHLFDGLAEVMDKAASAGLKLGVCTNKIESLSLKLLTEIGVIKKFGAIVGGDTLPVMKPDPAPYLETVKRLGVAPANSLMLGDSETDILTAKAAGVPVIAVTFGYTPKHVRHYEPTHMIDHYSEAWPLIASYF